MNNLTSKRSIYLDACATTPPHDSVISKVSTTQRNFWGNPSSINSHGVDAAFLMEKSRTSIAEKLSTKPQNIVFTSGATESIHLALLGTYSDTLKGRLVISSVEHPATNYAASQCVKKGWDLAYWPVDKYGLIDITKLDNLLAPPTKMVSLIWAQSEIGTIQPISIIGNECRKRNIIFHTDATQILPNGLITVNELPIDLISFSGHKLRGPKGIGALVTNNNSQLTLKALQGGGSQENNYRSGTQPVELIAGLAEAINLISGVIEIKNENTVFPNTEVAKLTKDLRNSLKYIKEIKFTGHPNHRLPNHISLVVEPHNGKPVKGIEVVLNMAKRGYSISSGTACSTNKTSDKTVLSNIGCPVGLQHSSIRISLGNWVTREDIIEFPSSLKESILETTNKT